MVLVRDHDGPCCCRLVSVSRRRCGLLPLSSLMEREEERLRGVAGRRMYAPCLHSRVHLTSLVFDSVRTMDDGIAVDVDVVVVDYVSG